MSSLNKRFLVAAASFMVAASSQTSAATLTWNGGAGGWSDALAWSGSTWAAGDDAILAGTNGATVSLSGTQSLASLAFNQTMTLSGGTLGFTGLGSVSVGTGFTGTISSAITSTGFTKTGAGTLVVSGSGSLNSGAITVSAGTLSLNQSGIGFDSAGGWGGTAITVASGATLRLASNYNAGFSRAITINGGTLDIAADQYANNLTLNSGAQVTGNSLRLGYHSNATLTVGGSSASSLAAGLTLVRNGANNNATLAVADATSSTATDFTVSGNIVDLGGFAGTTLTKTGAGTLRLSGTNTFTGGVTVSAGTLELARNAGFDGNNSGIGTGNLTIASGATVTALNEFAISGLTGSGNSRVVNIAGTLNLFGTEYVRTWNLTGGTLNGPTGGITFVRASAAGLSLNSLASATTSTITGKVDLTFGSLTLDVADGAAVNDLTITAAITQNSGGGSGSRTLTKTGAGALLLSGSNSFDGVVRVNAGTIKLGHQNALGSFISGRPVTQVVVASGATVDFNGIPDATYGYTIAGTGVGGVGALTNSGTAIGTGRAQASNITLSADASIGGAFAGDWALLTNGFNPTSLNLAGFTLTKTGANIVSLVNSTVSAGAIRISGGSIALTGTNSTLTNVALTLDNVSGAAFNNTGNFAVTLGSLAGGGATGGNVSIGSGSLSVGSLNNASTTYAGALSGSGSLTKTGNGTLTLSGNSTYSGGTSLNAGAIAVGSNTALGSGLVTIASAGGIRAADGNARSLSNNLSISANTTFGDATANGALTFSGTVALGAARTLTTASDVTFSGIVSGGSLTKLGNGRLTLGGVSHTFNGDLTVSAGSLGIASGASLATSKIVMADGASLVAAAGFTLGSGKQLQFGASGAASVGLTGAFTLGGGTLALDVGAAASDVLAVSGNLDLSSGTLAFNPLGGTYANGEYTVLTYGGTLTGSASSVSTSGLVSGSSNSRLNFSVSDATAGQIRLLVVGSSASLRWTGATSGTWDSGLSGTANWTPVGEVNYTGSTDRFYDLDSVAFDDTGANRSLTVGSALNVAALAFSNTTTDYTLAGAGSLDGLATITKSGAGALDLNVAYTGTGGVSLSAGTLRLLNAGFVPGAGATVAVSGGRLEVASGVTLGSAPLSITGGTVSVLSSAALGSGTVTVNGGTLELAATGTYSKALVVGTSGGTLSATAEGSTTYSPALAVENALTLRSSSNSILWLSGALSGAATLTKSGAGNVNLQSASGFTGAINVSEGLLVVESAIGTSGSHASSISIGGTLSFISSANQTLSGAITGAGSLVKVLGGGTLTLSSANTGFSGAVNVTDATLSLGHSQAAGTGAITLTNATLSRNVGNTTVANNLAIGAGGATLMGRQTVDSYTNFSGAITGSADLRIDGLVQLSGSNSGFTGKIVLADTDTYLRLATGSTGSVSAANRVEFSALFAHLRVDGGASDVTYTVGGLVSTSGNGVAFASNDNGQNAILDVSVAADATRSFSGYFSKNGTTNYRLRKSGSGTQVLNRAAGNGENLAGISVTGGVLELAGASVGFNSGYFAGNQAFTVSNGGTLRVSQDWNLATGNSVSLSGGTLDVTADWNYLNTLSLAGGSTVSGAFRAGNTGNATITTSGDLAHTFSAALTLVNVGGRTLTFNVADGAQADDLVVSAGMVDYVSETENLVGTVVSKTGAGTLVLAGTSTFSGNLSVGAGALRVTGTLGDGSYAGNIANSGALAFQSNSNQTLSGLITGSGGLTKSGNGVLTLSGANTYSGGTTINAGTVIIGQLGSLGSGTVLVAGGILDLNNLAPTNVITLSGGSLLNYSTWASTGTIVLSGNVDAAVINDLPGEVKITAGTTVNLTGVTKDIVFEGGTLSNLAGYSGNLKVIGTLDLSAGAPAGEIEVAAGGTVDFGSTASNRTLKFTGGSVTGTNFTGDIEIIGSGVTLGSGIQAGTVRITAGNSAAIASGFDRDIAFAGGALTGLNNYSGTVTLESEAILTVNDTTEASFTLASGAKLKGEGSIDTLVQTSGSILAPGNSPGTLTTATFTPEGGAIMEVEFFEALGFAGIGYDAVSTTTLDLSDLAPENRYILKLISLSGLPSTEGPLNDFDASQSYTFDVFTYASLVLPDLYTGGVAGLFTLDLSRFQDQNGAFVTSGFSLNDTGTSLQLNYAPIPEPSTYGLILGGLALAGAAIRRRRLTKRA